MKNLLAVALILIAATSCSSIKVSCDYDREAGFAAYKTYAFTPEAQQLPVDDINRARILKAVESELAAKGFTKSDQPDVLIDLNLKAQQVQTATANTNYGTGYRYRWGGGFSTTTIDVNTYTEGTLFVDMIDASKSQLVWQGRAVGTINPDASPQKREQNINYAVQQVFLKYPPKL
jgi:hypothetical protein